MAGNLDREEYAEFIRRIRAGDEHAAEELVRRCEPEIRLEIRGRLRLRNPRLRRVFDSIDICQSVLASFFVRAAIGEFDLDEPGRLVPLLIGMAKNKLAEQVRYHQRGRRDVRRVEGPDDEGLFAARAEQTPSEIVAHADLLEQFRGRLSAEELSIADLRSKWLRLDRDCKGTRRHRGRPSQAACPGDRTRRRGTRPRLASRLSVQGNATMAVRFASRRQYGMERCASEFSTALSELTRDGYHGPAGRSTKRAKRSRPAGGAVHSPRGRLGPAIRRECDRRRALLGPGAAVASRRTGPGRIVRRPLPGDRR